MNKCTEEDYSEKCFYCPNWVKIEGKAICVLDLDENEEQEND